MNEYLKWLYSLMNSGYSNEITYHKLFDYLFNREYIYLIRMDENRASDGMSLRWRYLYSTGNSDPDNELSGPVSVLEVIIALAIKCEEDIMDNPEYGDRTSVWFWNMIRSLGLESMNDKAFDEDYICKTIDRFLMMEYEADGHGGLFTLKNFDKDIRNYDLWFQLNRYLEEYF